MSRNISCYSTSAILRYAKSRGIDKKKLLYNISTPEEILENQLEWIDSHTWIKLACNLEKELGEENGSLYEFGRHILKTEIKTFFMLFLKIAPLSLVIKKLPFYLKKYVNKDANVRIKLIREGLLELYYTSPEDKSKYSPQFCEFNKGVTVSTMELKGFKNVRLTELQCAARSDVAECHYRIEWAWKRSWIRRKLENLLFIGFRDRQSIIRHLEERHLELQDQYSQILHLKDFYFHIMSNMSEGIVWFDEKGLINFVNDGFCRICGRNTSEIINKHITTILSDQKTKERFQILVNKQRLNPNRSLTEKYGVLHNNGERKITQFNIIWVTNEIRNPGFLCTVIDITDRLKMESRLYITEHRYRSLYENLPAIIIGIDLEGRFIYANPAMEKQSGYSEEELKRMHLSELAGDDTVFADLQIKLGEKPKILEAHFKTKSGNWKTITLNTYPIIGEDGIVIGISGIGVDITETVLLHEQLLQTQRMDLLGKMAGGLAHDFNNLLVSIMGYSRMIQDRSCEEKIKKYAEIIQSASERAAVLTRNLLTFSRGDIVKNQIFSLNALLTEVKELLVPVIPSNITVLTDISKETFDIYGDSGKLHQCILNMCINARDAIGNKTGIITLRLMRSPKKDFARIQVEDSGNGIPLKYLDKIFDPFFSTKARGKGTGLGLSVVYGVVKTHKGEITVDSRPGQGTIFNIDFPFIIKSVDSRSTSISEMEFMAKVEKTNLRDGIILIIDNDELMVEFCREILQNAGYNTVQFCSSMDALVWFEQNSSKVNLVLTDIIMPEIGGIKLVSRIREIKKDIKVIWMTGYAPESLALPEFGHVIMKPFTSSMMISAIEKV